MIRPDRFVSAQPEGGVPTLGADLHLWIFRVDEASDIDWARLNADERARAQRILVEQKKVQQAASRSALRRILAAYTGVPASDLEFSYGEHDKPELAEGPSFNLSHSGVWAMVGVMGQGEIGVDVELAQAKREFTLIAERFFCPEEFSYLLTLDAMPGADPDALSEQGAGFYRAWTRKEAYLKAWGTGLSFASSGFCIDYAAGQPGAVQWTEMPDDDPARWHFVDLQLAPDYPAAVCCDPRPERVRAFALGPER